MKSILRSWRQMVPCRNRYRLPARLWRGADYSIIDRRLFDRIRLPHVELLHRGPQLVFVRNRR